MNGLFSISGLVSGFDSAGMIDRIMQFASRPIDLLNDRIQDKQTLLDAYKTFEAGLISLKVDAAKLSKRATFETKTATVSDDTVLDATVSTKAAAGTYTLSVTRLAQNHQVASQGYADADVTTIGTGTLTIAAGQRAPVVVTIDPNNNTLEGLAQAINDADFGVQATIVNSGDANIPFRLLLTSDKTGAEERIVIDSALSGGTSPVFGTVAAVVPGTINGTSSVTSSGTFTGDASGTISFTVDSVQGAGTLGQDQVTLSYTDGAGLSGTFVIPQNYVAGAAIDVEGGLKLSFSAGTLQAGDTFSVGVTTSSIQAPLDAEYTLGSGGSALTLTSSTNTITDLVDGLTIDLFKTSASPVTLTVQVDRTAIRSAIDFFVEQYNGFVTFMNDMFDFNSDTEVAGDLLGDVAAQELYQSLQNRLTGTVLGVNGTIDHLVEAGIRMNSDGRLSVDSSVLDGLLADNLDALIDLFVVGGTTTDSNVRFLFATSETQPVEVNSIYPNGYDVVITQAAEKALLVGTQIGSPSTGSPIMIDSTNNELKIIVDGRESGTITLRDGTYTSGSAMAAEVQTQIDADTSLSGIPVIVRYVDDGGGNGHFEFQSKSFGANSKVQMLNPPGNSAYATLGLATVGAAVGKDVHGTINGEAATGIGQILSGDSGNAFTDGLQILVTLTASQLTQQGQNQGKVKVTKGFAGKLAEFISAVTQEGTGKISLKQTEFESSIEGFKEQIKRVEARLEKRRERLVREFTAMESLMSALQGQADFLSSSLQTLQSSRRTSSR